jgi:hypothetical protein
MAKKVTPVFNDQSVSDNGLLFPSTSFQDVDLSKYEEYLGNDSGLIKGDIDTELWNEQRARAQSGGAKVLNSIGQGVGTFGTALASSLAALGSGAVALGAETADAFMEGDQVSGMDVFLNNPIMKGVNDFDKFLKEDLMPTYYTKEQQDSFFSASTGTDLLNGLGFMMSAVVPAGAIGKMFGGMSKLATVAKAGKLPAILKLAEEAGRLTKLESALISKTAKYLDKAGPIVGGVVGRIGESAMEANQTYEQIKESLTAERDQAIQEMATYGETDKMYALNLTDAEIENRAKTGRNNDFGGNMMLTFSDISQNTRWFRGGGIGDRLIKDGFKTTVKGLTKKGMVGSFIKESVQEAGEEGFQFLLSKGAENQAKYGKSFLSGIEDASGDLFTTIEGIKSMGLGAILGGGMSSIAAARNSKKLKEQLNAIAAAQTANADVSQRYITDPITGKKIVNPELSKVATTFAFYEQQKDAAAAIGDQDAYDVAEKMQFSHLVSSKIAADQFDDFVDQLQNLGMASTEEMEAMFGELPIKNGKKMTPAEVAFDKIQLAKRVKDLDEGLQKLPGMEKLGANGMTMAKHMLFTQESLRDQIKDKDQQIASVQAKAVYNPIPVENSDLFEQEDNLLPQDRLKLAELQAEREDLVKNYKQISDVFKAIVAKPEIAQEQADAIQENNVSNAVDTLVEDLKKENNDLAEVASQTVKINGVEYTVADDPFSQDEIKLDYSPQFKESEENQRSKKQGELEEAFNGVNNLNESSLGQKVKYKGEMYYLTKDSVEDILQLENVETGQIMDIQKDEEFGYDAPLYYFGIEEVNDNPITDLIEISTVGENQVIVIDGKTYLNLYSNPLSAINYDEEGNIVSVSLNANNKNQSSRTFKKYAEEIAYAILLDTYNKLNNENQEAKREFAEKLKNADVKNDTERKESVVNERDTEETEEIEEDLSQKEEEAFAAQKELEDFNELLEIALSAETSEELLSYRDELKSSKYYNKAAVDKLNAKFKELVFNETNKDATEGTTISKEELLDNVVEKQIPEEELPETADEVFTTDEEDTEGRKLEQVVRKSTVNATTGTALLNKSGQMIIEEGERVQHPEFIAQTIKFNDPTISNNIVREEGDTPNTITFKAEKGTITEAILNTTNRSRLNDGLAPLTMEQFENDPNYFPIVLTLVVNGKEDSNIKSYYHNPEYYEKTAAWLMVENDADLDDKGKIAKHNANIEKIKKTRANLVDRIKSQGSINLVVASKSKGMLNYNPKVNGGIKTSNVIGILANSFEELLNGLTNKFYSGGMPINTSGIKVVTAVSKSEGFKYTISTQSNSGISSFESRTPYPIGTILFELIAPNGEVVTTSPFTKSSFSSKQIDSLVDLILLRLQGQKTINVDGNLVTIAGNEAVPGILDSVMYIGPSKSKETKAQKAQLFFTKDGRIRLGKQIYSADTEGIDVLIKNHLNEFKTKPHFKFKSVEIFGKNFGIPSRQEDGSFKIEEPSTYMEFLFGGENPLISTALNPTKFVNTYFAFATDSNDNLISTEKPAKAEPAPIITPEPVSDVEVKKAEIEKELSELGQKQLTKGFNSLSEATKPEQVANAIVNIEQNKNQGARLSKEQEQQLSEAKAKLKEQGYEIVDYNIVRYGENTMVQDTDFYNSEKDILTKEQANAIESKINNLEKRGKEVNLNDLPSPVSRTIKPLIKKDGVMVQAAEVNTLVFESVEQAREAIKKSREAGYKKPTAADKINAKYDAELAALEGKTEEVVEETPENTLPKIVVEEQQRCENAVAAPKDVTTPSTSDLNNIADDIFSNIK